MFKVRDFRRLAVPNRTKSDPLPAAAAALLPQNNTMETPHEYAESQVRRFLTVLFVTRAKRHLRTLAELYGWSPETLATNEQRFIRVGEHVPIFVEPIASPPEDDDI